MNNLYWFYDIFAVGIIIIFLCIGYKRGFLRNAVYIALVVASFFLSWFAAEVMGPMIYDSFIKEKVIQTFEKSAENKRPEQIVSQAVANGGYGVEISEDEVGGMLDSSDFFSDLAHELRKNGSPDSATAIENGVRSSVTPVILETLLGDFASSHYIRNALDTVGVAANKAAEVVEAFISGTRDEVAVVAERNLVAPAVKWLLKAFIFIIIMFILRSIISAVADAFKLANKVPVVGTLNSLLGAVIGLVEGAVFLLVFSLVVRAVINLTGNSLIFFNTETVAASRLFSWIYSFDFLTFLFNK